MSDGKMSELQVYQNLCREAEVIGQAHDLLMTGRFPGGAAMTLATCQGYLKGLYTHMKAEADKRAPAVLPELKTEASPVVADSVAASEPK